MKTNILDLAAKKYIAGFEILAIWEFLQTLVDVLCFGAEFPLFNNVYIFFSHVKFGGQTYYSLQVKQ